MEFGFYRTEARVESRTSPTTGLHGQVVAAPSKGVDFSSRFVTIQRIISSMMRLMRCSQTASKFSQSSRNAQQLFIERCCKTNSTSDYSFTSLNRITTFTSLRPLMAAKPTAEPAAKPIFSFGA